MSKRMLPAPALWAAGALGSVLGFSTALAADFPSGTFAVKQAPYTLTFDGKGQFHVYEDKTLQVSGSYSVKAGEVLFSDKAGPWACTKPGEESGTYAWKYEAAVLTFNKIADKCEDRVKSLINIAWKPQG